MIIGFSKHFGAGGSGPALDYLTGYLVNGEARATRPEVVRGDPKAVAKVIDALPFKRRYSSGVLSFAAEDRVTPQTQAEIITRVEDSLFAGLSRDRRSIVWIKHTDKGRTELHFVVARVDLGTRKSLNLAPPTPASRDLIDTLRTSINLRYGFRDPNDPACKKDVSVPSHIAKAEAQAKRLGRSPKPDIRQAITDRLLERARAGQISGRADVIDFLKREGFTITRSGTNYLTVVCPESGERVRLKGNIYREHFRPQDLEATPGRHDPARLSVVDKRLDRLVAKRAEFHRARYALDEPVDSPRFSVQPYDRIRNPVAPDSAENGAVVPGTRSAVCQHSDGLVEATKCLSGATHDIEHSSQRLDHARRAFAHNFESALIRIERDSHTKSIVSQYGLPRHHRSQGHEMELERDRSL